MCRPDIHVWGNVCFHGCSFMFHSQMNEHTLSLTLSHFIYIINPQTSTWFSQSGYLLNLLSVSMLFVSVFWPQTNWPRRGWYSWLYCSLHSSHTLSWWVWTDMFWALSLVEGYKDEAVALLYCFLLSQHLSSTWSLCFAPHHPQTSCRANRKPFIALQI